jgi:ribosomal protein L21
MIIQKSKDKPLQFGANLEKIIFRTFEKRSKNVRKIVVVKGRHKKQFKNQNGHLQFFPQAF